MILSEHHTMVDIKMLALLVIFVAGLCLAIPDNDYRCRKIGGKCQDVNQECNYLKGLRYYYGVCAANRYCCAKKIEDSKCRSMGGECDYVCQGAKPHPGICGGGLSCCIAFV